MGSSSSSAFRIRSGADLPATARVGDIFFKTSATVGAYQALTADTWTLFEAGAGGGTVTNTGTLTADVPVVGNAGQDIKVFTATEGSVYFAGPSGVMSQDNSNLFWNDTDKILVVGSPDARLVVSTVLTAGEQSSVAIFSTSDSTGGPIGGSHEVLHTFIDLAGTDSIANIWAIETEVINSSGDATPVGNLMMNRIEDVTSGEVAPAVITNLYGLFVGNMTAGSNNWAIKTTSGLVQFGDILKVCATVAGHASINIPTGTAPSSPADGDIWREDNTNTGLKIRINGVTKTIVVS